jgi:hypothetical protein
LDLSVLTLELGKAKFQGLIAGRIMQALMDGQKLKFPEMKLLPMTCRNPV